MSQINVKDLSFSYDGSYDMIFEHVSFRLDTDWKLGFIGRNGCGKTTFLKLLAGEYSYNGTIDHSVHFDYFPFWPAGLQRPVADIVKEICPAAEEWQVIRELNILEMPPDILRRAFAVLSNGERTKVLLAALFLKENEFLLLDEPTNHLDLYTRDAVAEYLRRKRGFILVSHDRRLLDVCTDHVLSVNRTNIEILSGNFSSWLVNKERQDAYEQEQNRQLKKEIGRLSDTARQKAGWAETVERSKRGTHADRGYIGHKAAKMMKRAKTAEKRAAKAAEEKAGLLKNIEQADEIRIKPLSFHGQRILEMKDVCIRYNGREICRPVDLAMEPGERIALIGKNGSGKSSILRLICGEDIEYSGAFSLSSGLAISYVPQDLSFLNGKLGAYAEENGVDKTLFLTLLRKLGIKREQFEKDISEFSDGQKKKTALAKSLAEQAHLYVWDEPLNYIDILSRMQIQRVICEYRPAMLFVEHDHVFVDETATKKIEISGVV